MSWRMEIPATATFSEIVDIGLNRTFLDSEPCEDTLRAIVIGQTARRFAGPL
jgi:hypothetical protein